MDFGEAKLIRLTPMSVGEPKAAEKPPFKAGSGLNALAKYKLKVCVTGRTNEPIYCGTQRNPLNAARFPA